MRNTTRRVGSEQGAALVIAIFSLMLISVVATSLILTSGTQTAVKSNYKSAMHAFYNAKAGLEEGRGRLWKSNNSQDFPTFPVVNCVFPGGAPMAAGQACYIINPANGENVDPRDPLNAYADLEYQQEWGGNQPPAGATLIPSKSSTAALAGPLYKWVRITARTEQSAKFDSDGDNSLEFTPLFLSGPNVIDSGNTTPPPGAAQILTITSLAVTPAGSRRMVQYTVAPAALSAAFGSFPSALILDGNGVSYTGPAGSQHEHGAEFQINGNDSSAPSGSASGVPAIGFTNSNDASSIATSAAPASKYLSPAGMQNIGVVTLPPALQTPSGLENLVLNITQNADLVLTPPHGNALDQRSLPPPCSSPPSTPCMSASSPAVIVVNGDFNLHGSGTGYGLLVVTGTLDYDPDASWNGVILVIGEGTFTSSRGGEGVINGAVFVAQTRDGSGNPLPDPTVGYSSYTQTGGGFGIRYSSSWVKAAEALMPYQVLSFREIQQTTP